MGMLALAMIFNELYNRANHFKRGVFNKTNKLRNENLVVFEKVSLLAYLYCYLV